MLIYEYHVRDKLVEVRAYTERIYAGFKRRRKPEHLLTDVENFDAMYKALEGMLPASVVPTGGRLHNHIGWLKYRLRDGSPNLCKQDIIDILKLDLPRVEGAFRAWCASQEHYDAELRSAITDLVLRREFASALREAFVILKSRMVRAFGIASTLDGTALVNAVFGTNAR